jgi:hypothetical protein
LELSRDGIALIAFGPNPDGAGTLLRLWELAGQSGRVTVKLPPGMTAVSAQPVDLRGRSVGKPVPTRGGAFRTSLNAFAPASFVLQ